MKISGAAFRTHLEETLDAMGYKPRYADLAAWILKLVNPNEFEYYEYILCYVNDVLLISTYPGKYMRRIQEYFKIKDDNIAEPDMNLRETFP